MNPPIKLCLMVSLDLLENKMIFYRFSRLLSSSITHNFARNQLISLGNDFLSSVLCLN